MKFMVFLSTLLLVTALANAANQPQVVFVSPEPGTSSFWRNYESMMQEAAKQLNIRLTIIRSSSEDRFGLITAIEKVTKAPVKPDYVVSVFKQNQSLRMLNLLEQSDIKFFATSSDVPDDVRQQIGLPTERYKNWIGHLIQDDSHAGKLLMDSLFESTGKSPGRVVGFSGSRDSTVAFQRNNGLIAATELNSQIQLNHIFFTNWDYQQAQQKITTVLKRFPDTRYIWCASDEIAAGVLAGLPTDKKTSLTIGSIDWTETGIKLHQQGDIAVSVGGHFAEGAFILALIKDHMEGKPFATSLGLRIPLQMGLYNEPHAKLVEDVILPKRWDKLNFNALRQNKQGRYPAWESGYADILDNLYSKSKVRTE